MEKFKAEFVPVVLLHRDDIESRGFKAKDMSDAELTRFADKLGDALMDSGYWAVLDIIADEVFNLEEKPYCLKCEGKEVKDYKADLCEKHYEEQYN